ncbi:hypothetical protein EV361DRAFT_951582 [Lentinula raphanica]|nr:hypothetical protein EV361DRAFT_951582 [Lentinula raphanica]
MTQNDTSELQERPRLLLRSSSSRQAEGRERVTHKPNLISLLKKLSLIDKLKKNVEIEASNDRIRLANSNREDTTTWERTASLVTITSDEFEGIRISKSLFEKVKEWIPDYIMINMEKRNRLDVSNGKRPRDHSRSDAPEDSSRTKNPRLMPDIVEKSLRQLGPVNVQIHEGLWDLAKHHRYLHLALFTDQNLIFINNYWTRFKSAKVMVGDTKVSLPILKDILDRLGLPDPDSDPIEGLTYPSFQQAAKNYYAFEKERDTKARRRIKLSFLET